MLKHAGKYGCRAQTSADTVFSEAELLVRGDLISQSDVLYFLKLNQFSKLECFRRISKTISQFVKRAADFLEVAYFGWLITSDFGNLLLLETLDYFHIITPHLTILTKF